MEWLDRIRSKLPGAEQTMLEEETGRRLEDLFVEEEGDITYSEETTRDLQSIYETAMDIETHEPESEMEIIEELMGVMDDFSDESTLQESLGIPVADVDITQETEGRDSWREDDIIEGNRFQASQAIDNNGQKTQVDLEHLRNIYDEAMESVTAGDYLNETHRREEVGKKTYNVMAGIERAVRDSLTPTTGNIKTDESQVIPGTVPAVMYTLLDDIGFEEGLPDGGEVGAAAAIVDRYFDTVRAASALLDENVADTEELMDQYQIENLDIEEVSSMTSLGKEGVRYIQEKLRDGGLGVEDYS